MNKSVYSLVLMDNVVGEVDKLAYEMGTSRSNLINQILAEYVRYTTPEMRMRAIFDEMEKLMQGVDSFQIQPQHLGDGRVVLHDENTVHGAPLPCFFAASLLYPTGGPVASRRSL